MPHPGGATIPLPSSSAPLYCNFDRYHDFDLRHHNHQLNVSAPTNILAAPVSLGSGPPESPSSSLPSLSPASSAPSGSVVSSGRDSRPGGSTTGTAVPASSTASSSQTLSSESYLPVKDPKDPSLTSDLRASSPSQSHFSPTHSSPHAAARLHKQQHQQHHHQSHHHNHHQEAHQQPRTALPCKCSKYYCHLHEAGSNPDHLKNVKLAGVPSDVAVNGMQSNGLATSKTRLLQDSLFPPWERCVHDSDPKDDDDLVKLQQDDPLATKIWRMYSRTKAQLAGQERVENLTWRMMAMTLKKERVQRDAARAMKQQNQNQNQQQHQQSKQQKSSTYQANAPKSSGIAQLRQSLEESVVPQPSLNSMDLDDLIVPSSMGPPSGQGTSPPDEDHSQPQQSNDAGAIPIRPRKGQHYSTSSGFAAASVPNHPPELQRSEEFGYVQRRVRKTSIDERM
ncbi:hypothetical protein KEM56_003365, partial [Ascosphaera pollenicola]